MSEGSRRSTHVSMPVVYAAVGATRDADVVRFPPAGFTPYEEAVKLGSGGERFTQASSLLMTWHAQRAAGVRVTNVVRSGDAEYEGVRFDADGQALSVGASEDIFGPDGEPYLTAGTGVTLVADGQDPRRVLVIYTVNEDKRVGFAWGTSDEQGVVGEQRFTVEHREDGSVWAVARGFLAASTSGLLGLKARSDLRAALESVKRQLQALTPGAQGPGFFAETGAEAETAEPATTQAD